MYPVRNGGVGQHALDVVLHEANRRSEHRRERATMATFSSPSAPARTRHSSGATIYTPAVTMVAAWINAETGVGFHRIRQPEHKEEAAPTSRRLYKEQQRGRVRMDRQIAKCPLRAAALMSIKRNDPRYQTNVSAPRMNPASPMRFTMNAC